ncbi:MAG: peptidylprolyl isomerase [Gammaproteobacteria bacterium]|nr:peptidylprolyl isomerase [Gammaproteobacteria bacterium]
MTDKNTSILQRFLREPLLHFIAIGGLFFLIFTAVNDVSENSIDTIIITPERIAQIATGFNGVWNRMPTAKELDNLIKEEVRSEVYYRDALALGLDKNDAMVRRRLQQKMEFLTDTVIYLQEPSTGELETYFTANEQVYRSEPRLAFEQIYLGESPPEDVVSRILKTLLSEPAMESSTLGQRTFLPAQLKLSSPGAIDSVFGKGFYDQVAVLAPGEWVGPVMSSYGTHLIRTLDGRPGGMPSLEEVRDSVLRDWNTAKALEHRELDYAKRRSRYTVEILRDENRGEIVEKESR